MHLQIISAGTQNLIKCLKSNPNYDILSNDPVRALMPSLSDYCKSFIWRDTTSIMNLYPPLRLHPMTRGAINNIVMKHKKNLLTSIPPKQEVPPVNPEDDSLKKENPML